MNWFPGTVDMSAGLRDTDTPKRTPTYREYWEPVTEPWQRASDTRGYEPRHRRSS